MVRYRVVSLAVVLAIGAAASAGCSSSSKTSSTSGSTSPTSAGGGLTVTTGAAAGTTVDITATDTKGTDGPMQLILSQAEANAGDVTFRVKNTGTIEHEAVLLKVSTPFDQLQVTSDTVSEEANIGETGDPPLKPGETRSFTVKSLTAGSYVLVCNIAKHYGLGMRAAFTIK